MRSSLCACWTPAVLKVLEDHRAEVLRLRRTWASRSATPSMSSSSSSSAEDAVRREALNCERSGDAHLAVVGVGLVVEVLEVRLRGDRGVDLALACDALFPPLLVQPSRASAGHPSSASRGISHSSHDSPSSVFSSVRSGSSRCLELLPDDVDLGVVGDVAEHDVWHALVDEALADVCHRSGASEGSRCA